MRFEDEPVEWMRTRQITRVVHDDPRGPYSVQQFVAEKGEFDQFLEDLNDPHKRWEDVE